MKSKKAVISASFLVGAIITIVSFIVIAPLAAKMVGDDETKIEKLCQESVAFRAKWVMNLKVPIGEAEIKAPIFCKVIDKDLEGNKEELMEQIAQKMARCWWQFNEGKFEQILEGSDYDLLFFGTDKLDNDCSMCYTLTIEEKEIEDGKITSEEFADYFRKTEYKKAGMTYLEYFQRGGGPGKVGILTPEILPGHTYGVNFLAKNKELESSWEKGVAKIIGGAALTALVVVSGGSVLVITVGVLAGTGITAAGLDNLKAQFYEVEREVSVIYLDTLSSSQDNCFKGDLGGE